jgi:hypothetical protein
MTTESGGRILTGILGDKPIAVRFKVLMTMKINMKIA